ncbi:MAG TPA: wax ester/triacylglycerol synthase family O-acyltransferase [Ilumatobacteraceae bacterium]|nr:wax ester/triacylglycerol synthase family O-acyltransferase [Ilumatobacteraceae bacterium]HRB01739.1 wax ester/triacylglycerol synthase family O-acyltransferase [Ilumatobacteraceae bacterium]
MSALDALFLHAEDGTTHMHIGSCAVFTGKPPTMDELTALIASKLPLVHRFRQKVRLVPGGLGRPVWVDDPGFDIAFHVRHSALPPRSTAQDLDNLMGRLMSQELDRDRPLWELWLVEGLPRKQWALISKVHHCMVDGVSGTDMMTALLDATPDAVVVPAPEWTANPVPSDGRLLADAVAGLALAPARLALSVIRGASSPRESLRQLNDTFAGLRSFGRRLTPQSAPLSIEGSIGGHRRWAVARCTLGEAKEIRRVFGGSVNDVVLAAITAAFRDLLVQRGDVVDHATMSSLVPVSIRSGDDHSYNNQVSMVIAALPVGIADPLERLRAITANMDELKLSNQATAGAAAFNVVDMMPPALFAAAVRTAMGLMHRTSQRTINTVTTNVFGPSYPLYALGREMVEYLPFVPLSPGVRIGVAILSYNGHLAFGVTGDYDSAPDVQTMADGIEAAIGELSELAARTGASPR